MMCPTDLKTVRILSIEERQYVRDGMQELQLNSMKISFLDGVYFPIQWPVGTHRRMPFLPLFKVDSMVCMRRNLTWWEVAIVYTSLPPACLKLFL
jgi:hypothetical protein